MAKVGNLFEIPLLCLENFLYGMGLRGGGQSLSLARQPETHFFFWQNFFVHSLSSQEF